MTVVSTVVRAAAAWTGAETEIPTGIQVQERSQLVIGLVPDEGERQALTLGLHYAVTLSPAGVATVVPLAAFPPKPGTVSIVRQTPMTQGYDPTATDTYDAAGHAAALDRSAMRVAELSQKVDDVEAAAIVVVGGAAGVPAGAVYVSDGEGGAVAGPTSTDFEAARAEAVSAAKTAKGAEGVAISAAKAADTAASLADQLSNAPPNTPVGDGYSARHWTMIAQALSDAFDLDNYSSTAQIETMLEGFVPKQRKVKVGTGLALDGVAGGDALAVSGDLSEDRLISLNLAAKALAPAIWNSGADATEAPISPEKLKAAATALSGGLATMQTVANVSGSRAFGTVYQNGSKTRMFSVNANGTGSFTIGFGPTNSIVGVKGTTVNGSFNLHLLVPPWWYYGVIVSSGISGWAWFEAE